LLSLEELPVDAQESATAIFRSASHLLKIVNQLLDISKADSGNQELKIEPVAIRAAIEEMMTLHIVTANRSGTTLALDIAANVPGQAHTDATALKRIMHNLIANALQFTKAGAIQIRVGATASHIRFEVSDTGIGISPENQRRLFTNYTQVHDFETRETAGTGLGLALARSLVELLGGNIGVDSVLGRGSTFWFTIPGENTTMSADKGQS
jgi:two-component system, sensor histidine kinase and response regulator